MVARFIRYVDENGNNKLRINEEWTKKEIENKEKREKSKLEERMRDREYRKKLGKKREE